MGGVREGSMQSGDLSEVDPEPTINMYAVCCRSNPGRNHQGSRGSGTGTFDDVLFIFSFEVYALDILSIIKCLTQGHKYLCLFSSKISI